MSYFYFRKKKQTFPAPLRREMSAAQQIKQTVNKLVTL